jgi:hypothetical protein
MRGRERRRKMMGFMLVWIGVVCTLAGKEMLLIRTLT